MDVVVSVGIIFIYLHMCTHIVCEGLYSNYIENLLDCGLFGCFWLFIFQIVSYLFNIHLLIVLIIGLIPTYIVMKWLSKKGAFIPDCVD